MEDTATPLRQAEAWARQPGASRHSSELVDEIDRLRELHAFAVEQTRKARQELAEERTGKRV